MVTDVPTSELERCLVELGFDDYQQYLDSTLWAGKHLHWQIAGMPEQCLICGRADYNLHHRSYTLLGAEPLGHLAALCEPHHYEVHRLLKRRQPGVNLWNAHLVYRKLHHARRGGHLRRLEFSGLEFLGQPVAHACELTEPKLAGVAP